MQTEVDKIYSYFDGNPSLKVLFIFDDRFIADTLQNVEWKEGYRYEVFNGSWFKTKYNITHEWTNQKVVLLFQNMISPLGNAEQMRKFPLLDLLIANTEYKATTWEQFVQEYEIPAVHADYVRRHVTELEQVGIKNILLPYYTKNAFNPDVCNRGIISAYLGQDHLIDWIEIIARMIVTSNTDKRDAFFRKLQKNTDVYNSINDKLAAIFGVKLSVNNADRLQDAIEIMKYNAITQTLSLDSKDIYHTLKIDASDRIRQINSIIDFAANNAKLSEAFFKAIADQGKKIHENEIIKVYGYDADYRLVTSEMFKPIIKGIVSELLPVDSEEVQNRISNLLIRLDAGDVQSRSILNYIDYVALLNASIKTQQATMMTTTEEFVSAYTNTLYLTDSYYRQSLAAYGQIKCDDTELEDLLKQVKSKVDDDYTYQCNVLNRKWVTALAQHNGFDEIISAHRQQDFFKEFVAVNTTKTVVIVVDALRFELAQELLLLLAKDHNTAYMENMLAMVPTETKYCKSALLPHDTIAYDPEGVVVDGQKVAGIDPRSRYLASHVEGAEVEDFEKVFKFKDDEGKAYFKKNLVYIMYNAIDELCHPATSAEDVTNTCQTSLEKIRTVIKKLHNSWNVKNVIVTSDHGFIYNDIKIDSTNLYKVDDTIVDKEKGTRYYLTDSNKEINEIVKLPLSSVSAFTDDIKVGIPSGTMRLSGHGGYKFAHGGASLQEIIIPVIVSSQVRDTKVSKVGVNVMERNLTIVSSMLRFNAIQTEPVSMEHRERTIICGIYDNDRLVSEEIVAVLNSTDSSPAGRIQLVEIKLNNNVQSNLLKLKIFNKDKTIDYLNPLYVGDIINNTLIERDEF